MREGPRDGRRNFNEAPAEGRGGMLTRRRSPAMVISFNEAPAEGRGGMAVDAQGNLRPFTLQ